MDTFEENLTVYDNCLSLNDCLRLVNSINEHEELISGYFNRCKDQTYNNPYELLIDDFLTKIDDKSEVVEYWYRKTWLDITFHQDLNEYIVDKYKEIVNPNNGHILYLNATNNTANTCFLNGDMTEFTKIAPKIGRIVRFNGKFFHGVPNSYESIFNNENTPIQNKYRHVLLFNTWNADYVSDKDSANIKMQITSPLRFKPMCQWIKLPIFDIVNISQDTTEITLRFMGGYFRRNGLNKKESFIVDKRLMLDSFNYRIIIYTIKRK